ncbi:amino acid ABC transporter substrate-binding protein [Lactobacillus equicursoris]|uniref:amino acid ABC transporter substrate-binding protein n=1 Tax=Lactobacillus equicursoris TaxID=420645 RepID=UPI00242F6D54|nr:amino acid ABC transporter substrate-binding protein [Lactobacillus equicursoris]MDD6387416.1 amino acid ABC transporter substrate-binding protein [Lactobacillus equicursoris]
MKWVKKLALVALLFCLTLTAACSNLTKRANTTDTWVKIKKRGTLVIGLDDTFVPMGFREKNGQLVGYDIDLAKAVCKKLGLKADFQTIDWSMKETELRNGTIDALWNGYSVTASRKKKVAFSRSYLENRQVLVVKKSSGIKTFSQMQGKSVGVQSGSTAQIWLEGKQKALPYKDSVLYDTIPSAFLDLNAGRIQGILLDETYAEYYIQHEADSASYKEIINQDVPTDLFAVGLRKGDKTLRKKINQALADLQKSGELAKINQKWFGKKSNYLGK